MPVPDPARPILYVDTCAVIEAVRAKCWNAIVQRYDTRTVTEVRGETQRGDASDEDYVAVDITHFDKHVKTNAVTPAAIALVTAKSSNVAAIHKGEAELLAHVFPLKKNVLVLCTADRAAVKAACALGLAEKLISLEEITEKAGCRPKLPHKCTKKWLSDVKTQFYMDTPPPSG